MAKTRQVGVRFDEELLKKVKDAGLATSPQKALNLYERSYLELIELKVENNNKPENKAKIETERDTVKKLPTQTITTPKEALVEVSLDELEIKKQIAAIQAEKIPKERDTPLGRTHWAKDQEKKIKELRNKLNSI